MFTERERERTKKSGSKRPATGKQLLAVGIGGLFVLSSGAWADSGGIPQNSNYYGSSDDEHYATIGASVTIDEDKSSYNNVYGGYASSTNADGEVNINVAGNTVTVNSGDIGSATNGAVYGGFAQTEVADGASGDASANASSNTVTVTGGNVHSVQGGYTKVISGDDSDATAIAYYNMVTVTGGDIHDVIGGYSNAESKGSGTASALSNYHTIQINGGSFSEQVFASRSNATASGTGDAIAQSSYNCRL